jgi:hypothetical protein
MTGSESATRLIGEWTKAIETPCAEKYPATIRFSGGTYRGTRGPGQGMVWWDAGIYRLEGPDTLVLGVATDELVTYAITLGTNEFEFSDDEGCRVVYTRRASSAGPPGP